MRFWNLDASGGNEVQIRQNLYVLHFDPTPSLGACVVRVTLMWIYSESVVTEWQPKLYNYVGRNKGQTEMSEWVKLVA